MTTIKVLFALTYFHDITIHLMDVKKGSLSIDLNEVIYMELLEGYVLPGNE